MCLFYSDWKKIHSLLIDYLLFSPLFPPKIQQLHLSLTCVNISKKLAFQKMLEF